MRPHWAAIIDCSVEDPRWTAPLEGFALALYGDDGHDLEWLQYDTLDIALDQAVLELGIDRTAWDVCQIALADPGYVDW